MPGSGRVKLPNALYRELAPFREDIRDLARKDIDKFIQANFKIKIKEPGAPLQLIKFNYPQLQSRKWRAEDRERGMPVRHFYLKSRQVGQSTDSMADAAAHTWAFDNYESLVIAHDKTRASKLLNMAHTFFDNLPAVLQLILERSTSEQIRFKHLNSGMAIMTAANFEAGRGNTIHEALLSEFCYYDDPPAVVKGINQLLPLMAGTQGIIETTAYMAGSPAHKFWEETLVNTERDRAGKRLGNNAYKGYFHAWQDDPSNVYYFATEREQYEYMTELYYEFPDIKDRQEIFKLTPGQVAFYGMILKQKCEGDELFCQQEYPCDPTEAWTASGVPIFPLKQLAAYRKSCLQKPGTLFHPYTEDYKNTIRVFQRLDQLVEDRQITRNGEPYIEVWQRPVPKRRYLIGADGAAGYTTGDYSCAYVVDMHTLEMCVEVHGRMEPSDFATVLRSLGKIYNDAIIAPEVEGMGLTVLSHLKDKYVNIYYRREETATGGVKVSGKMGWSTNTATRPGLIANAKRLFLERFRMGGATMASFIRSERLVDELRTFINGPNGKPQGAPGCHDDRCMAWFITLVAALYEIYNSIATEEDDLPGPLVKTSIDTNPRMDDVMDAILEWANPMDLFED